MRVFQASCIKKRLHSAGKSTIGSLLLSLYSPNSGSIRLRDVDIDGINPSWLRANIGIVAQEPVLFSASIADNIRFVLGGTTKASRFLGSGPEGDDVL